MENNQEDSSLNFYENYKQYCDIKDSINISKKDLFIKICKENIKRNGIDDLLNWLDKTDFYTAPASTKFHGCVEQGLLQHSLNVYFQLKLINQLYSVEVSEETLTIISLLHDLCKVNFYKKGFKNVKDENGKWIQKEVYEIEDKYPFGYHADKSIIIIQSFLKLKEEEIYAIRAHMGGFDVAVKGGDYFVGKIFEKSKISVLLHLADMISTYLIENK